MKVLFVRAVRSVCGIVAFVSVIAVIASVLIIIGVLEPGVIDTERGVQASPSEYWYGVIGGVIGLVLAGAIGGWAHRYLAYYGY